MWRLLQYYGQWQGARGRFSQLPSWARLVLLLAALPGIALIALSILAFLVSLLALLLLTVPLFRLLNGLCGVRTVDQRAGDGFGPVPDGMDVVIDQPGGGEPVIVETPVEGEPRPARRQIDVKIVE